MEGVFLLHSLSCPYTCEHFLFLWFSELQLTQRPLNLRGAAHKWFSFFLSHSSHFICYMGFGSLLPTHETKTQSKASVPWPWLTFLSSMSSPSFSPLLSLSLSSLEFHWYSVSQSWHSTSSVSPQFQLAPALERWLLLLDNAHPCLHRPLLSGIPALLVTTGGSGWWGHCLCLAWPCSPPPLKTIEAFSADTGCLTDRQTGRQVKCLINVYNISTVYQSPSSAQFTPLCSD